MDILDLVVIRILFSATLFLKIKVYGNIVLELYSFEIEFTCCEEMFARFRFGYKYGNFVF